MTIHRNTFEGFEEDMARVCKELTRPIVNSVTEAMGEDDLRHTLPLLSEVSAVFLASIASALNVSDDVQDQFIDELAEQMHSHILGAAHRFVERERSIVYS